jgi:hypothetical protein
VYQARQAKLVSPTPVPGAAVVYTNYKWFDDGRYVDQLDAVHIGLVLRVEPVRMSIEGNTTLGKFDRNGFVQALKEVDEERVYTYILPGGRQP